MADLNSMIAQGAQFQAPIDPFAQYGKMQQLQQYQNQNELARYTMAKARQEDVTRNALNQAIQSNINADTGEIDYPGVYKSLAGANAGASIPGLQKSQFDLAKERAALDETKAKTLTANILNSRSVLTGVNDQASYDAWRQDTVSKIPQFAKVIPTTYTPETHAALLSTSEELAKRMDVERQRLQRVAAMGGGAPAPAAAPATLTAPTPASSELAPGAVPIRQGLSPGASYTNSANQTFVVPDNQPVATNNMVAPVVPVANQLAAKPDQTSVITTQIQKLLNLGDPDSIRAANVLVRQLAQTGKRNLHNVPGVGLVDADSKEIVYASQEKPPLAEFQGFLQLTPQQQAEYLKFKKAGAANVSATATTGPVGKSLSEPVGKRVDASLAKAEGGAAMMDSANTVREALNAGNVIAGPLAGVRTKFAQVLELAGAGDKEKLINTRTAIQGLASLTLESRSELKGQGAVTDFETKLLEKARSGNIEDMTIPELQQIVNIAQRFGQKFWDNHQSMLNTMKSDPAAQDSMRYYVPTLKMSSPVIEGKTPAAKTQEAKRPSLGSIFGPTP